MEEIKVSQLAIDAINRKPAKGIPTFFVNLMDIDLIEEIAGVEKGKYFENPEEVYIKFQKSIGVDCLDQFIPKNPMEMGKEGFDSNVKRTPTTGADRIIIDGIEINSPEAVVEHMERFVFPSIEKSIKQFNEEKVIEEIIKREKQLQKKLAPILKTGHGFVPFPYLRYTYYGYVNYFCAYALYPEVMEKDFSLQADYAEIHNKAVVKAYKKGNLPPMYRLDHDMADSRGTLVNIKSLEKIWLPHFQRAIKPLVDAGINLIWHCDGNLMEMVPLLIEAGVKGFQGFQYETGMDYEKICKMKTKDGQSLIIIAGVSVTKTLPYGTPEEVKKEMEYLVENGPETGLFLSASSSITPNTNRENILTFIEGLKYYRKRGKR